LFAFVSGNMKRAKWSDAPNWWPKHIQFRDPNNGNPKMKLWEINEYQNAQKEGVNIKKMSFS